MTLYTPLALRKFYRKRYRKKPGKYLTLSSALESARLKMTVPELLSIALFYPLLSIIPGVLLGFLVSELVRPDGVLVIRGFTIPYWEFELALVAGFAILAFGFTRYLILTYPFYLSNIRKGKIESSLPHAVNMMLGMAKGGVPLISIFGFVAENREIFGEVSREFDKVVTLVEVFGYDLISAMKYVSDTTPSEKLKVFLENFINVYEGGGDVVEYLRAKSEQLLTERETYYTLFFETLQVFAEVYLALFIVAPLFFLTVLVVFQMIGSGTMEMFRIVMFTFIPLGSLLLMWLINSSMPSEPVGFAEHKKRGGSDIFFNIADREPGFKIDVWRLRLRRVLNFLKRPLVEEPYLLTLRALSFYLIVPAIFVFVYFYGKIDLDLLIFITLSVVIFPSIVFIEYKRRLLSRMERELPEFMKQLASLNEAGLNVVEALRHISESELGMLGKEIRKIKREVEWGELITSALEKIESRIRSQIVAKAITLLVKAIESTPSIRDALNTASMYSELEIEVRDRIKAQMSMYTIIIYLAFAVFLYTAYILIQNMLTVFVSVEATQFTAKIDLKAIKDTFMQTSLLVAFFSGIMAGQMGEGRIEAGLKHVFILVVVVYVFFKFIIP
ncbi:type II secretion system F family protein [Archaeoglobus sp.]